MSGIEGGEEGAHQLMHNDAHDIDEFSDDVDSVSSDDSGPWGGEAGPFGEDGMAETHFDNEEDSIAFQGIPRYYYRHIRVLKRRNKADFEYDFDNVLNDAGRERLGIILATRSMYLSSLDVKVQNEHSFRFIFHGPFQQSLFLRKFSFDCENDTLSLPLEDLSSLFQQIQVAPTLKYLSLSSFRLDKDGVNLFKSSLGGLRLVSLHFRSLDNEYDALKDVLPSVDSSALQTIDIVGCSVGRETCRVLGNMLKDENSVLDVLNLDINNIDNDCVKTLCESLKTNRKLRELFLGENFDVTDDAWGAIKKLVFDTTSMQNLYQSNHSIQFVTCHISRDLNLYLGEILRVNKCHGTGTDSQILKMRGCKKIVKYLSLGGESNMEIMDDFELSLMPHVLAFFSKKCPALHILGTETVLFHILRHWNMPMLYSFFPLVKIKPLTQVDELETKMPTKRKIKHV